MKAWKKVLIPLLVVILIILIGNLAKVIIENNLNHFAKTEIVPISLANIQDGEYFGEYSIFPIKVKLEVSIKGNRISEIKILEHRNGQGKPAEGIIGSIITKQNIDVAVISGASYSSRAIQKSIEKALMKK